MTTVVHSSIAADLATLTRLVPVPVGPLGYGRDLRCVSDVTETLEEVDPESIQGIAESQVRRLTTARGLIADLPNDGIDLRTYVNRGSTSADLVALRGQILSEVLKDDRIERAVVTVTVPSLRELSVEIRNTPADPSLREFTATLAVTDGAALLKAVS